MLGVQYLNWYRYCKIVLVTEVTYCTVYRLCLEIEPAFVSTGKCKVLFSSLCRIFSETRPRTVHTLWTVLPLDASGSRVSLLGQLLLLLLLLLRLEEKEGLAVGKPVVDVL